MKKLLSLIAIASAPFWVPLASADTEVITGVLATPPTFNRPIENDDLPPIELSASGTAVPYSVTPFFVTGTGPVSFAINGTDPTTLDTYATLYVGAFDPLSPLTNALIADDDDGGGPEGYWSAFSASVTAGTQLFLVVSTFGNTETGSFTGALTSSAVIGRGLVSAASPVITGPQKARSGRTVRLSGQVTSPIGTSTVEFKVPKSRFKTATLSSLSKTAVGWTFRARLKKITRGTIVVRATNAIGQISVPIKIRIR